MGQACGSKLGHGSEQACTKVTLRVADACLPLEAGGVGSALSNWRKYAPHDNPGPTTPRRDRLVTVGTGSLPDVPPTLGPGTVLVTLVARPGGSGAEELGAQSWRAWRWGRWLQFKTFSNAWERSSTRARAHRKPHQVKAVWPPPVPMCDGEVPQGGVSALYETTPRVLCAPQMLSHLIVWAGPCRRPIAAERCGCV